tara:strand:+ start:22 stop:261 length:240 start_codon:yes stop_codon:yes gene_type:complete
MGALPPLFLGDCMAIHFVGFRTDAEYMAAVRVYGKPDFIHLYHDRRMYGDIDPDRDIVVLGSKGRELPCEYSDQDHERH